jgi:hypothetical protein
MVLIASVVKLRVFIDSADFAKKYGCISLILQKSPVFAGRIDGSGIRTRCDDCTLSGSRLLAQIMLSHSTVATSSLERVLRR